jgi:hypothetical protein
MHRYRLCTGQANRPDVARITFPDNTPPGKYVAQWQWRGYYDIVDVEIVAGTTRSRCRTASAFRCRPPAFRRNTSRRPLRVSRSDAGRQVLPIGERRARLHANVRPPDRDWLPRCRSRACPVPHVGLPRLQEHLVHAVLVHVDLPQDDIERGATTEHFACLRGDGAAQDRHDGSDLRDQRPARSGVLLDVLHAHSVSPVDERNRCRRPIACRRMSLATSASAARTRSSRPTSRQSWPGRRKDVRQLRRSRTCRLAPAEIPKAVPLEGACGRRSDGGHNLPWLCLGSPSPNSDVRRSNVICALNIFARQAPKAPTCRTTIATCSSRPTHVAASTCHSACRGSARIRPCCYVLARRRRQLAVLRSMCHEEAQGLNPE